MKNMNTLKGRIQAHLEATLVDHGFIRALYRNLYKISDKAFPSAFRSNHPSASFVKKMSKNHDIKTIISLRRPDNTGQYLLEKEACDQLNIKLEHVVISSRCFPAVHSILEAKQMLESVQYPILIHCKSGADRAGIMSVFYKHFIEHQPIHQAVKQLSMKYGHFRWADTGKLDAFFDAFLAFEQQNPNITFLDWVQNHYQPDELNKNFDTVGWVNILVNRILKRE